MLDTKQKNWDDKYERQEARRWREGNWEVYNNNSIIQNGNINLQTRLQAGYKQTRAIALYANFTNMT